MSELAVPHLWLPGGHLDDSEAFPLLRRGLIEGLLGSEGRPWRRAADKLISWMTPGFGDAVELKILDHVFGDGTYAAVTPYLALTTAAVNESDVAASMAGGTGEANYTGYLRKAIAAADMSAAAAGSKTNGLAITFDACTGGSAVVIGWAVVSAGPARLAAGDVVLFGTCTSTTISTTQTPATVAPGGLVANLD